jgi:hypothetical protein
MHFLLLLADGRDPVDVVATEMRGAGRMLEFADDVTVMARPRAAVVQRINAADLASVTCDGASAAGGGAGQLLLEG